MTAVIPNGPVAHVFKALSSLEVFKRKKAKSFSTLTEREREVLALVADGLPNPGIAERLQLSRLTVQNHRASIRQKLGINSEADYVKFALAYELIQL